MDPIIKIESSVKNICKVEFFLNSIFKDYKFSRKVYCRIYLSSLEAVNNAILHGNNNDPNKYVTIKFSDTPNQIIISVIDDGNGFDFQSVADPTMLANIKKESGRGIFIMKQYADKVKYNSKGNQVKLIFNK